MICPNCQRENQAEASFCAFCGQFLAAGQQTRQAPVPSAPPLPSIPPLPNVSTIRPSAGPPPLPAVMCLVCGQMFASQAPQCPHCKTPRGMIVNPEDPTGSTYLPYGAPYPAPNTSTMPQQPQRGIAVLVLFGMAVVIGLTILSIALVVSVGDAK